MVNVARSDKTPTWTNVRFMAAILALMAIFAYSNSLLNGFVWDDSQIVVNNPINRDLANIRQVLFGADVAYVDDLTNYYRPLNRLTYMIEYPLFGLNPQGYHLVNILIHAANVLLLFLLGLRLFREPQAAFASAMLFAVHPINAEAVNFISGRNNALTTLFILLSVLTFIKGERTKEFYHFILAGLALFGGLLCKEIALMTLPFLLLAPRLDNDTPFPAVLKQRLLALVPGGIAVVVYFLLRLAVLNSLVTPPGMGLWQRLAQNFYALPKYLELIIFPAGLKAYHIVPADYPALWPVLLPGWAIILGMLLFLLKHRNIPTVFGLLWFVLNYIPISQVVVFPSAPIAERYAYLPAIGLWLMAGALVQWLITRSYGRKLLPTAVIYSLILTGLTLQRNGHWRNDLSLFSSLVSTDPTSVYGHYNLGCTYKAEGEMEKARWHWQQAVQLDPRHSQALNQLGSYAMVRGELAVAEQFFTRAVNAGIYNAEAHYNLAMVLAQTGRAAEAIAQYELFLRRVPFEFQQLVPEVKARIEELRVVQR